MKTTPIDRLIKIMAKMRAKGGCPWDREQTLATLKQYLIEESYEVIDAIDSGDVDKHAEELGDLLLQVVFQAQIRKEKGQFNFNDVVRIVCEKLIRRHPHVFGKLRAANQEEVLRNWEKIKVQEKRDKQAAGKTGAPAGKRPSIIDGLPRHLPSLHKAHQFQQRLARVGFDWANVHDVMLKIEEELGEVKEALARGNEKQIRAEIGDLLFAVVNLCRFRKMHAEEVLQDAIVKFTKRFQAVEKRIHAEGREITQCSLAELDKHWEAVKKEEVRRQRSAVRDQPVPPKHSGEGGRSGGRGQRSEVRRQRSEVRDQRSVGRILRKRLKSF